MVNCQASHTTLCITESGEIELPLFGSKLDEVK
jgi:hypothetical protein